MYVSIYNIVYLLYKKLIYFWNFSIYDFYINLHKYKINRKNNVFVNYDSRWLIHF